MNSVFVKVNAAGCVVAVNSDAFLAVTDGWIKVDDGEGDRYALAQGLYLPGPMLDSERRYRYKLVDGTVVERTAAELAADTGAPVGAAPTLEERLAAVEAGLLELALGGDA